MLCTTLMVGRTVLCVHNLRAKNYKKGGKAAIKIGIGLIPLFIVAGLLESYVTRLFGMPLILKLLIIGGSLAFVLFYFVFYPRKIAKNYG